MEARITKKRECNKEKEFDCLAGKTKQIHVPLERSEYKRILEEPKQFRKRLDGLINQYPEIFPEEIDFGYILHDFQKESKKLPGIRLRRIKLKANGEVFSIMPSFVMPYMTGYTEEVEKPLFLRQFGVPYWGLTYVFGKNDMYWYRLENSLGRNSIVGTTIKQPENLPDHLIGDEKFSWWNGHRVYIPITVADDCVLSARVTPSADHLDLICAYGDFKKEAQNIYPDYQPKTVTTDGWKPTRWAWQMLFPSIQLILCFLHSFLKIRDCFYALKDAYSIVSEYIWQAYRAADEFSFRNIFQQLRVFAINTITSAKSLTAISKLCDRVDLFAKSFSFPGCYRTTAKLDRLMDSLDRFLYSNKYFHAHLPSSQYSVRSWAILHNFLPYSPRYQLRCSFLSPAHKFNGFVYHRNWLKNLIVSASMGGFRYQPQKPLE